MPNPLFMPVIGSGFGDVMNQQANWTRFNSGIEEGNASRLGAAQQNRNNWLAQIQALQQQQADRQYQSDLQSQRNAEIRRQFDIEAQLDRENIKRQNYEIAAEDRRTAADTKALADRQKFTLDQASKKLDSQGRYYTERYGQIDPPRRESNEKVSTLSRALEDIDAQVAALKEKTAANIALTPDEIAAQSLLTKQRAEIVPMLKEASKAKTQHETDFSRLLNTITSKGYDIIPETGEVVHLDSNLRWSYKQPKSVLRAEASADSVVPPSRPRWAVGPTETGTGGFVAPSVVSETPRAMPRPAPSVPQAKTAQEAEAYIAQANQAIARGADPVAVKSRLKAMGIQLRE